MASPTRHRPRPDESAEPATKPFHLALAVSLYPHHGVALVTLGDPRSDGRPRRLLASLRIPVGHADLVGDAPVDASLAVVRAAAESLYAMSILTPAKPVRHPRRGSQGRPVILRGQQQLTFD
jgi:hypothetical protein